MLTKTDLFGFTVILVCLYFNFFKFVPIYGHSESSVMFFNDQKEIISIILLPNNPEKIGSLYSINKIEYMAATIKPNQEGEVFYLKDVICVYKYNGNYYQQSNINKANLSEFEAVNSIPILHQIKQEMVYKFYLILALSILCIAYPILFFLNNGYNGYPRLVLFLIFLWLNFANALSITKDWQYFRIIFSL